MLKRFKESVQYVKEAYISSAIVFGIAIFGFFLVGRIYNNTLARGLIEAMQPAVGTLCFAVITSASTVITLLMAVLGFARRSDNNFDHDFYIRIVSKNHSQLLQGLHPVWIDHGAPRLK